MSLELNLEEINISLTHNESSCFRKSSHLNTHILYIVFGSTACFANFIICIILLKNRKFLRKSAFMAGYAFSETFLGVAHVVVGALRLQYHFMDIRVRVHPLYCMYRSTTLIVITSQLGSTMLILIGVERLLAAVFFKWYYNNWTPIKAWTITCLAYVACLASAVVCWLIVLNYSEDYKISLDCSSLSVSGNVYSIYQRSLVVFSGIWVSGATLFSLILMLRKRSRSQLNDIKLKKFENKQLRMTISMTVLACVEFMFVVIPGSMLSLAIFLPKFSLIGNYASIMVCVKSTLTIFVYTIFNSTFRSNLLSTFCTQL